MNKTAIKNYAIWARVQLIEAAKQRAYEYEITDGGENKPGLETIGGRLLSKAEKEQRNQLIAVIHRKGFAQVMEEAAYTWFNRFVALRFMEVNGYLPSKVRVFTDETGAFKPEILKQAMSIDLEGLDRSNVMNLLDKQNNEELFKYLLITQCNALNAGLPYMFEKIANWTELLFPTNLLRQDSVIGQMISEIPEEDWTDAVQIIGWMYQYYNSELKDETFALLKKNVKITKERIPAATQLFTPDWIVRYMVENSLGRLWYEGHPGFDKSQWKYYLDEAEQEPEVEAQLQKIRAEYAAIKPEEIKVIDPCMGSGHILVYAFDVLMQIYTSAGWSERDAAQSILENNLYGLDIDDRAGQLAYFAVMMKARKHSRRILNGEVKPNVLSIQDSNWMTDEFIAYVAGKDMTMKSDLVMLRKTFKDAKEYGSILNVPAMQYDALYERINIINRSYAEDLFQSQYHTAAIEQLLPLVKLSQIMSRKYDVVVTNPPYMGQSGMSEHLNEYVKKHCPDGKMDLYACFIEVCNRMLVINGFQAMITMHSWMFLTTFTNLRQQMLKKDISSLIHLGARAFDEIGGEVVQTVSFVYRNSYIKGFLAQYRRLLDGTTQDAKEEMFLAGANAFTVSSEEFKKIPGMPFAYWIPETTISLFSEMPKLGELCISKTGMTTGDNNRFLREWYEVDNNTIFHKWFFYNKGGGYRKWYGSIDYVIIWENDGEMVKNAKCSTIRNPNYYFKRCISWNLITTDKISVRAMAPIFVMGDAGPACYIQDEENYWRYLGLLNSVVSDYLLKIINPTINYSCGVMEVFPVCQKGIEDHPQIIQLCKDNVAISTIDWNTQETSRDFQSHPLVPMVHERQEQLNAGMNSIERKKAVTLLSERYSRWAKECEYRFSELKRNEEELNRIFINIYGLHDELVPTVDDGDVTVRKADLQRDVRSFISYAVGCMFGRYSIDNPGLVYAGGRWDSTVYKSFQPDKDAIIPICDDEYFEDDAVGRFVKFVEAVFGVETLEENLRFIANALGGKGTSREVIRNYFQNGFYDDHLKVYQKRPIYWLFSSGKKNGFKALVYMHRYQPDLLARMRTDYVHEQQERYRTQLQMLEISTQTATPSEKVKLNKQISKMKDQTLEIQKYEEKIHHLADQMISINLDDGVKANYAKFQDVLEKIK